MLEKIEQILNSYEKNQILGKQNNKNIVDILSFLKEKKIIIYPAGVSGQLIQKTLQINKININFFLDKAYKTLKKINDIKVQSTEILETLDNSYIIIIASNLKTQYDFFNKTVSKLNPNLSIIDGKNLNRILKIPICAKKLENNTIFDLYECENCGFERQNCEIASKYLRKIANHKTLSTEYKSKKFDWFGYIVSQTCTLKCEHCCEQVPHQKGKGFSSVETIIKDVKKLAESSKFLNFVELVGGEPLLHPEIEKLLTELLKIENIGYIKSFTNATVVPSDELCKIMKNPRFMLHISNYESTVEGKLLNNIHKTKEKLSSFNVKYLFTQNFEWLDFNSFDKHEATEEYLKKAFDKCFLKNCNRVYKGKLYRCPHQYAGALLNKLEELPTECVDIHSIQTKDLGKELDKFENVDFIDACRYCELAFNPIPVPAGIQLK